MPPRVTVAVVSYRTPELLAGCLDSLRPDVEAGLADVWVVDNASGDSSASVVRERFAWATLIESEENLGFGRAVNRVAAEAPRTEWLAIANADTAVEPGALAALVAAGGGDDRAGALAPRLVRPDGSTQHSVFTFPTFGFTVAFTLGLQRVRRSWGERHVLDGFWDPARGRHVPWAIGAFLLVRRWAWDEIGGFDASQWLYAEDLDLGWRLRACGWTTRYVADARVGHIESAATAAEWGDARSERFMAASYAWMLRRRGPLVTRGVALVGLAGARARWAWYRLHGERAGAAVYARWARGHRHGLRSERALGELTRGPGGSGGWGG